MSFSRDHADAILFYFEFFREGLRLPIDMFIVQFLDRCRTYPCDLHLTTVRALSTFTVVSRLLGFEPDSELFRSYFIVSLDKKSAKFSVRAKALTGKLFHVFLNKQDGWSTRGSSWSPTWVGHSREALVPPINVLLLARLKSLKMGTSYGEPFKGF